MRYRIRARPAVRAVAAGLALMLLAANHAAAGRPATLSGPAVTGASVHGLVAPQDTYRSLFPTRGDGDRTGSEADGGEGASGRARKIVGSSLLASGLFLCSWGISSWQVSEYQCCPAKNTDNVVKIVAGIVLLNAGLIYLLDAGD